MELEELTENPLDSHLWLLEEDPDDPAPAWVDAYEY
jgi:hypothetical protein